MESKYQTHEFPPLWDNHSRILILGTFPSVKSRETRFYYGHPQNRFWKVLAALTKEDLPQTVEQKKALLLTHGIALWDVIQHCRIVGSSDSSIRDVIPSPIGELLNKSHIHSLYANGATAKRLYDKYILPETHREICLLPSTSPANAAYSLERLIDIWGKQLEL